MDRRSYGTCRTAIQVPGRVVERFTSKSPRTQPLPPNGPCDIQQSQMEQSLKRLVTLVIWCKISTFPHLQLAHSVVSDLELTPASYIDAYNCHGPLGTTTNAGDSSKNFIL
ncbi:hypothetical protein BDN67DRAFT_971911, partial [Paxillus ammoniavirescens]